MKLNETKSSCYFCRQKPYKPHLPDCVVNSDESCREYKAGLKAALNKFPVKSNHPYYTKGWCRGTFELSTMMK